ncbi:MAG TPA: DUF1428 family protein [Nitrososphaeraceae archaeon]|nr:DUF1428 family protein [Nitrososphaeraceae archaeon]
MSQSDLIEKKGDEEKNLEDEIQTVIYRFPKKDHDKMVAFSKPFTDIFRKYGVSRWGIFQLSSTKNDMEFTNIAKTVSANLDEEEVWIEIFHYNDKKHKDEVMEKMKNDKNCDQGFQQFMKLITPGSSVIIGDFSSVNGIEFIR